MRRWWLPVSKKRAASNTDTVQNGKNSQIYREYRMPTCGVPNTPFQGLSEYTHIPLPTGHVADSTEATMTPTLENPPRLHKCYRRGEIFGEHTH